MKMVGNAKRSFDVWRATKYGECRPLKGESHLNHAWAPYKSLASGYTILRCVNCRLVSV